MNGLEDFPLACPYCGESQWVRVDLSVEGDRFIEDCQICCRPMVLRLSREAGEWSLQVAREDDA